MHLAPWAGRMLQVDVDPDVDRSWPDVDMCIDIGATLSTTGERVAHRWIALNRRCASCSLAIRFRMRQFRGLWFTTWRFVLFATNHLSLPDTQKTFCLSTLPIVPLIVMTHAIATRRYTDTHTNL